MHLRSLFPSPSRSPSPVPSSSSGPSSTPTSRSPSPFSFSASLSKTLPPLPGPGSLPDHLPVPAPGPEETKPQPKNKISTHRLHQLITLLTVLNLTKLSLQREQDSMADILHVATTTTGPNSRIRTPSPDAQDMDLLALASNACRARRYRTEEPASLRGFLHWQGVVDELGMAIKRLEAEVEGLERERMVLEESW
ncbi:hypothetical protein QBC32DRAFT_32387 [Pseudoneurospora amorphoporcata]|uniref:Uncharacterized protein n=1 Tax=Pseudoneurospora amorphoporcata TaxID=241081 RepID=A0AAN6NTI4_9PEZI|nr:hypothetical protein QBC32DRAFT_32387 [Pseudoneurospora amorphoporcata]